MANPAYVPTRKNPVAGNGSFSFPARKLLMIQEGETPNQYSQESARGT
jgi:hypothetical protein